jgi:ABC-type multidrug transport system fused ATPase/permease subunit
MPLWRTLCLVAALAMMVVVFRTALRSAVLEHRVLGIAVVLIVLCGARDIWVMRTSPEAYAMVPWIRIAWVGFAVTLAWVIAERMRKDARAMAAMNASLEAELAERNAALEAVFAREREGEKARGALEERQASPRTCTTAWAGSCRACCAWRSSRARRWSMSRCTCATRSTS